MINLEEEKAKFKFKIKVNVRWSDQDEMRHVNNAVYLTYFEESRIHYFHQACKWDWNEIGAILANVNINYLKPVVFGNETFVYIRTSKLGTKSFEVQYLITSIVNEVEELTTTGSSTMVVFDYKTNKSAVMPEHLRAQIMEFEPGLNN
jgi:acyl-CoA thioester hydrolase